MDISIPTVWCVLHGVGSARPEDLTEARRSCRFCQEAIRQKLAAVRLQNALFSDRCGFCGGPKPCLHQD